MVDFEFFVDVVKEAGAAMLEIYRTEFSVEIKEDRSPLTLADRRSHEIISRALQAKYPDIPILSEEGKAIPYSTRREWSRFWCVDPLDGTKEFIKKNDEFTINIALIEDGVPTAGVVYLPVRDVIYLADKQQGCWEVANGVRRPLHAREAEAGAPVRVLVSRSHASPKVESILELLPAHEAMSRGSSLKFCSVASGEADFYPRTGPTWEWDTAAGQAVVTAAGGVVVDFEGKPFTYNKPDLLNGPFLVAASLGWLQKTGILDRVRALA